MPIKILRVRCEVCGKKVEQITIVMDYFEVETSPAFVEVQSAGVHYFCVEHKRKSKCLARSQPWMYRSINDSR